MEIRLKQKDVEQAIAMFLASQGVARPVTNMTFNPGRKNSGGLTVDVECAELAPGYEPAKVNEPPARVPTSASESDPVAETDTLDTSDAPEPEEHAQENAAFPDGASLFTKH